MASSSQTSSSSSSSRSFVMWLAALMVTVAVMGTVATGQGADKDDYQELFNALFQNYSVDIRPVNDYSTATDVYMTLYLLSILEVNEKGQTLKINTILEIEWYDWHLSWYVEDFQNITSLLIRQKQLWLPDLVVSNTVTSQKQLGYDNLQVCNIEFQTAVSDKREIRVYIDRVEPVILSRFSQNGLWELISTAAENINEDDDYSQTKIRFKLQLQRRRSYYVLNIILPILLLSLTSSLTFALPSDAGEKMGLSITVLLAFAVYLTLITEAMPTTSMQVSVVTVYLIVLLSVASANVIFSVFILRLHHRPTSSPVTGCLAAVTPTLRSLLCMTPIPPEDLVEEEESSNENGTSKGRERNAAAANQVVSLQIFEKSPKKRHHPLNAVAPDGGPARAFDPPLTSKSKPKVKAVQGRMVAETLDKAIFVMLTVLSLASTVVCFIVLYVGASKQASELQLHPERP
ncbi:neuronal acetylcholine receptor subunit alpha-2-like [Babylonia areolata]|uniref:neuronal acetylcholine receptor subunit alpha-2-like n=1 Tax=Babylonia areolata TaxID=304850 RepID=UPI003FCFA0F8